MRVIKFRAWHKGFKKMFSAEEMAADQLTLLPTGQFINVSGTSTRLSTIIEDMIPLQFSETYDKNGCEVYDGDVIHKRIEDPLEENGYFDDRMKVGFEKGSFGWYGNITGDFYSFAEYPMEDYEVVGNVYEHPELIQKKEEVSHD